MQGYKRQQIRTLETDSSSYNPNTEQLQTLGMRIRQSISNGYQLPNDNNVPTYMNNYEQQQMQNKIKRVNMPVHLAMTGPPALNYNGSTASSLSCWEEEINKPQSHNFHSLESFYDTEPRNLKRGISDVDTKEMQMNDFVDKYGPLSFNEDF